MFTKDFWLRARDRSIKTFAQTAVALLTAGATGLLDVDWILVGSVSGLAALISVLTSVAGGAAGSEESSPRRAEKDR